MLPGAFIALYQAFGQHVLEQLETGGVSDFRAFIQCFVNITHGAGPALPKNAQNGEFGFGGRPGDDGH
jgi:hypothetical protein